MQQSRTHVRSAARESNGVDGDVTMDATCMQPVLLRRAKTTSGIKQVRGRHGFCSWSVRLGHNKQIHADLAGVAGVAGPVTVMWCIPPPYPAPPDPAQDTHPSPDRTGMRGLECGRGSTRARTANCFPKTIGDRFAAPLEWRECQPRRRFDASRGAPASTRTSIWTGAT